MPYPVTNGGGFARSRQFYGVQDYQDIATSTTPISVPNGTYVDLTNDGLGPLSSEEYAPIGYGPIFNTSTGDFDFSGLDVGDMVFFRTDIEFVTTSPNTQVSTRLEFGPSPFFYLPYDTANYKSVVSGGAGRRVRYFSFQMKSADTVNNTARLQVTADSSGVTCVVYGWQIETMIVS